MHQFGRFVFYFMHKYFFSLKVIALLEEHEIVELLAIINLRYINFKS